MANIVEIAIRGLDEATRVFEDVGSSAQKSMEQAEASVSAVDDTIQNVSDLDVDTGNTEQAMDSANNSIEEVQDTLQETEKTGESFGDKMSSVFESVAEKWKEITVVAGTAAAGMEKFSRSQADVNAMFDRVAISTGLSSDALRDITTDLADATTNSAEQAEVMEMLVKRGIDTEDQFRAIIPELSNFGTATGKDLPEAMKTADGLLKTLGLSMDDVGDNTDQLTRLVTQTDIPLEALQRNLGRVPDELQAMEFGLDDVSAGVEVFRDRGFEGREAVRNFRRAVDASEGDMDAFLENIGLTNKEWEEYQKKVEPAIGLTEEMAGATENNMTVLQKLNEHTKNLMVEYGGFADLLGMLAPLLMAMGPILKGISGATEVWNWVLNMNPVMIVVTAIIALIAIIALLWKNWDEVSAWLSDSWQWIKDVAVELFGGLGEYFTEFWDWLKELFIGTWEAITEFLTVSWEWIQETASTIFESIGDFFSGIWDWIMNIFSSALDWIDEKTLGAFSIYFDTVKYYFEMIWGVIQDVWEYIKNTFKNALDFVKALLSGDFEGMKNAVKNQMDNIWNLVKNIWNRIKDFFSNTVSGIRDNVTKVFENIKDKLGGIWEGISEMAGKVWGGMVDIIKAPVNTIIGIVNAFINGINSVKIESPKIPDWVPKFGGKSFSVGFNIPNIPQLAEGGLVSDATLALIGEGRDREAVLPLNNSVMGTLADMIVGNMGIQGGQPIDYKVLAQEIASAITKVLVPELSKISLADLRIIVQKMEMNNDYDVLQLSRELKRLIDKANKSSGKGWG